jgi:hypothetical protein
MWSWPVNCFSVTLELPMGQQQDRAVSELFVQLAIPAEEHNPMFAIFTHFY